jgi:hypothetical protein
LIHPLHLSGDTVEGDARYRHDIVIAPRLAPQQRSNAGNQFFNEKR